MTNVECHNHPHNFYTQILGETGLIGLTLAVIFFAILVFHCYNDRKQSEFHVLSRTAFVIPLAIFWPLQPNADFFGQWNNCFIWRHAIGYSLCCARAKKEAKNEKNFCFWWLSSHRGTVFVLSWCEFLLSWYENDK